MKDELKVNQKIRNFLGSLLYEDDMACSIESNRLVTKPEGTASGETAQKQIKKRRIMDWVKDYWLVIVVILISTIAVALFILRDIERHKGISMENTLIELSAIKNNVQQELADFKKEAEEKAVMDAFVLARHRSLLSRSRDSIQNLLDSLRKEKAARLESEKEAGNIKDLLLYSMKARGELERRLMAQDPKSKKDNIMSIAVTWTPSARGSVSAVNVEDNFVVVDLGKKDHLTTGSFLAVYRNNMIIGRLLVVLVDDRVSVATIIPAWRDIGMIEEGDIVRTL